jgi:Zn-dependent peptidase ImmA (M78 family)
MFRDSLPTGGGGEIERAANSFAAELLMPVQTVRDLVIVEKILDPVELAKIFDVSEPAMKIRLSCIAGKSLTW